MLTALGGAGALAAVGGHVRTIAGVVRSDLRPSFGGAPGLAAGVGLTFCLTLLNLACTPMAGAAVYAWHCDREGRYSLYSTGVTNRNYLRGIQVANSAGTVTFTSIYPGCYAGRWPHIHFEVYRSLTAAATPGGLIAKTSQIALPRNTSAAVYNTTGYAQSVTNLNRLGDSAASRLRTGSHSGRTVRARHTAASTVQVGGSSTGESGCQWSRCGPLATRSARSGCPRSCCG